MQSPLQSCRSLFYLSGEFTAYEIAKKVKQNEPCHSERRVKKTTKMKKTLKYNVSVLLLHNYTLHARKSLCIYHEVRWSNTKVVSSLGGLDYPIEKNKTTA